MSAARPLCLSVCRLAAGLGPARGDDPGLTPAVADAILQDQPLTIEFRQVIERPREGVPSLRCWSINSAGQAELTVVTGLRQARQASKLTGDQMRSIRQVLRDERFLHLRSDYGPLYIHGGWSALTDRKSVV